MNRDKIIAGGDFMDFETERKIAEHLFSQREENFEHASLDRFL